MRPPLTHPPFRDRFRAFALPMLALSLLAVPLLAVPVNANGTDPALPVTARGNEPGWVVVVDGLGARLSTQDGAAVEWPVAAAEGDGDDTVYAFEGGSRLRLTPALCHDTMTGLPYPVQARLDHDGAVLTGCGGDPAELIAGEWRLADLPGSEVPATVAVTLMAEDGRVSGHSGCNRYAGGLSITGEGVTLGPLAGTRMACEAPGSTVEAAYLAALDRVSRFDIAGDGALLMLAGDDLVARFLR